MLITTNLHCTDLLRGTSTSGESGWQAGQKDIFRSEDRTNSIMKTSQPDISTSPVTFLHQTMGAASRAKSIAPSIIHIYEHY